MGARADGWWRDRAAAARRLSLEVTELARRADSPAGSWVLVLEGRARDAAASIEQAPIGPARAVRVVPAPGSGDDAIVAVAAEALADGESCLVVTADRELRRRCEALGAATTGPSWLLSLITRLPRE